MLGRDGEKLGKDVKMPGKDVEEFGNYWEVH